MSRARSVVIDGSKHWFDMKSPKATAEQLELLATIEDEDIDELLESSVTQAEILRRLRGALGQTQEIPAYVLERRQKWREARQIQPQCRMCGKEGDSTRHHFVNKWILKELDHYTTMWASRRENCIPVCIDCHRDLHDRSNGPVSIADKLTETEKEFANRALQALADEHPKLLIILARGDDSVYEARLVKDWFEGKLEPVQASAEGPSGSLRQVA
jgi:5-methylcytosine-specific restriction endonuclease McrA